MIRIATIFTILIMGLIAGPAVSLFGSPSVAGDHRPHRPPSPCRRRHRPRSASSRCPRRRRRRSSRSRGRTLSRWCRRPSAEHVRADEPTTIGRRGDRGRQHHGLDRRARSRSRSSAIVGEGSPPHDSRVVEELAAHLLDDWPPTRPTACITRTRRGTASVRRSRGLPRPTGPRDLEPGAARSRRRPSFAAAGAGTGAARGAAQRRQQSRSRRPWSPPW